MPPIETHIEYTTQLPQVSAFLYVLGMHFIIGGVLALGAALSLLINPEHENERSVLISKLVPKSRDREIAKARREIEMRTIRRKERLDWEETMYIMFMESPEGTKK